MATFFDIAHLLSMTKSVFPAWKAEEETGNVWHMMLNDLSMEDLTVALLALNSEPDRVYAPSVGEIRGKVVELRARQSGVPTVYEAWEELLHAPPDGIVHYPPQWSEERGLWLLPRAEYHWRHPLVEHVARQLGWPDTFPGERLSVALAQFRDAYQAAYHKELREAAELPLVTAFLEQQSPQIEAGIKELIEKLETE